MTKPPPRFPLALERVAAPRATAAQGARPAPAAPTGHGLDSAGVRARMVARLRADGVRHQAVLDAFGEIPRHLFVDSALAAQAYEDTSLPIGHGQTISKPSVVARMLELLFAGVCASARGNLGRTLEIGTGCGYQAALLCLLSRSVVSMERLRPLHDKARDLIAPMRRDNLRLVYGDGRLGHAPNAPYDTIVAAAGGNEIPPGWLEQLAIGGRLVAPLQDAVGTGQALIVIDRTEHEFIRKVHEPVRFVPLKSGVSDPRQP
jgi:protein-L-isoaspartate(D-aspartate) O-methyltransferase